MEIQDTIITGTNDFPYHVSIGGIVVNKNAEICVHHFDDINVSGHEAKDFYILMRESPNPNEDTVTTLNRGLMEEFGIKAKPIHYIGSIKDNLPFKNNKEKTTLYFLCNLISQDENLRAKNDPESHSKIVWHTADFLIEKMTQQGKIYPNYGIDEHTIIERVKELIVK